MTASRQGNAKIVRLLIKAGANVDARLPDGRTALLLAIEEGHSLCVDILIKAGADVNLAGGDTNRLDSDLMSNKNGSDGDLNKPSANKTHDVTKTEAVLSNPTGTIVIKPEMQEISDDSDEDNNAENDSNNNVSYDDLLRLRMSPSSSGNESHFPSYLLKSSPRSRSSSPFGSNDEGESRGSECHP